MLMKEIIAAYDVLDSSFVTGEEVKNYGAYIGIIIIIAIIFFLIWRKKNNKDD